MSLSISGVVAHLVQLSSEDQRKAIQAALLVWSKEDVEVLSKWILTTVLPPVMSAPTPVMYAPPMMLSLPPPPPTANGAQSIWHQSNNLAVVKKAPVPMVTQVQNEQQQQSEDQDQRPENSVSICGDEDECSCFHPLTKTEQVADEVPEFALNEFMIWFDNHHDDWQVKPLHAKAYRALSPYGEREKNLVKQIYARQSWDTQSGNRIPANARIFCRDHQVLVKLMSVVRQYIAKHSHCGLSVSGAYPEPNGEEN